jgi:predicted PurR-regulated permease PerM
MNPEVKMPFYTRIAFISVGAFAFVFALYIAESIIVPLVYAGILAIALNPAVNYLMKKGIGKLTAIAVVVSVAVLVLVGIVYLISMQLAMFSEAYPKLLVKLVAIKSDLIQWISATFNIPVSRINAWTTETQSDSIRNFAIGEKLSLVGQVLIITALLPVYLAMILYYKPLLLEFLRKLFQSDHHVAVVEVLNKTKEIIQGYLVGLFLEMLIVAVLNSVGLLLIGIDYAILLGIIGAVLNLIPYIGGIVGISLPMLVAFVTKETLTYPAMVFVVYIFIQLVDNNYIVPRIVAARVRINALVSVVAVLVGGTIWGVPGMFLSIPLTAIAKVIFDHVESLKPWGYLFGNIIPTSSRFSFSSASRSK